MTPATSQTPEEEKDRRARERAEKRLQTLTKEVDYRVARTYVALAADTECCDRRKRKEDSSATGSKLSKASLEALAVDQYLDDEEWERGERREGRGVFIQKFPYSGLDNKVEKVEAQNFPSWLFGRTS